MKKKVYVGMSGGVDSSVVAMMLRDQGYEVIGVFIKTWQPDYIECTWREDRLDAMRVAAQLDIKFETLDLSHEYKTGVIDYMISEYMLGRTPNPDVMCNSEVKFGAFYNYIKSIDKQAYIATGHYAKIIYNDTTQVYIASDNKLNISLAKANDKGKDQVYFLAQIDKDILPYIIFPLGEMKKSEVRDIARNNNLYVSEKKDSQGLCMLGDISIKDFLQKEIGVQPYGNIFDLNNEIIGRHNGAILYTIGERIAVNNKDTERSVYYVKSKDIKNNTIIATTLTNTFNEQVNSRVGETFILKSWNSTSSIEIFENKVYACQSRYHGPLSKIKILEISKADSDKNIILNIEILNKDMLLVSGQTLVIYDDNMMLGGGIIA